MISAHWALARGLLLFHGVVPSNLGEAGKLGAKLVQIVRRLSSAIPFGDPVSLLATAALIILAFVPVAPSRQTSQNSTSESNLDSPAVSQVLWDRFPLPPAQSPANSRTLYPFSVVPGGVEDAAELQNAIAHDPVVAGHYAGFNVAKLRRVRATKDMLVYVSYRMGSEVFWTKRPLTISRGETLISDGEHQARTRCGNRLSETPGTPVSPAEPPNQALEEPPQPELLAVEYPTLDFPLTAPPPPPPAQPLPEHGRIYFPPIVPIWWGAGQPGVPPSPPVTPPPNPPPVPASEPGSFALVAVGIGALCLARRKFRPANRQN
jgi:hypothetical protein